VGEDDTAQSIFAEDSSSFCERLSHSRFEELLILSTGIHLLRFVLNNFLPFWGQRVGEVKRVIRDFTVSHCPFEPDEKKV
jgi:hypothetical protein